jgi:hypothetical protein
MDSTTVYSKEDFQKIADERDAKLIDKLVKDVQIKVINALNEGNDIGIEYKVFDFKKEHYYKNKEKILNTLKTVFPDCIITDLVYIYGYSSNHPIIKINFSSESKYDNLHIKNADMTKLNKTNNTFNFLLPLVVSLPLSLIILNQFFLKH